MEKENNSNESDFSENEIPDLNSLKSFKFEPKTNMEILSVVDDDYRQVHAHTHLQRPVAPHKVITSLHQRPVKQALHHTII